MSVSNLFRTGQGTHSIGREQAASRFSSNASPAFKGVDGVDIVGIGESCTCETAEDLSEDVDLARPSALAFHSINSTDWWSASKVDNDDIPEPFSTGSLYKLPRQG